MSVARAALWFLVVIASLGEVQAQQPAPGGEPRRLDGEPRRLDGTTDQTYRRTVEEVRQQLPIAERDKLEAALVTLATSVARAGLPAVAADPDGPKRRLRDLVHGKTAAELIALADEVAAKQEAKTELGAARLNANEAAAIATLRNLISAQAQFQATGIVDVNRNGLGEHGFFGELSGVCTLRNDEAGGVSKTEKLDPPVLSTSLSRVQGGRVQRSGYYFQIYLPGPGGEPARENERGGAGGVQVAAGAAEKVWCCYAWPSSLGSSGKRAFFANQDGDVLGTSNDGQSYTGLTKMPEPMAAFAKAAQDLGGALATNGIGRDGQTWNVLN